MSAEGEVASMVLAGGVESQIVRSAEVCREMRERNDSLEARINSLEGENVEITGQLANSNDVIAEKDEEIRALKEKCGVLEQVIERSGVQERTGEENNANEEEEEDENPLMNVSEEEEEEESWVDQVENEENSSSPEVCNENNKRDRNSPGLHNLRMKSLRRNFDEIVIGANYVFNMNVKGMPKKTMGKLHEFRDPWAKMVVKEKDGSNVIYNVDIRSANLGRQSSHP